MKKICHVTSVHSEEDGRIFRRACISSARAGYDTYLVEQGESYCKSGVNIIGIGMPKKNNRLYRMTKFARKAIKAAIVTDADLYQLHDPELLPYALKLKKLGKAVVFDSHEDYTTQFKHKPYLPKPVAHILSWCYDKYSRHIFARIDGVTYPGNTGGTTPLDGQCKIVVPTDNLPWLEELYDKYDPTIKKEPRTVCYIGALDEDRGITDIVNASYDAGCTLYLAGKFFSDEYRHRLESSKEFQCVKYIGIADRKQVLDILGKSQVGLCVLRDVGQYHKMINLPTKVYEYMSLGLPAIINESPYNKKIVDELGFGICVKSNDRKALADAIKALIEDDNKQTEMGKNGRKAIRERYCWDMAQNNLLGMYKKILGE